MKVRSSFRDPSTRPQRRARSGFRLAAQTPPRRLNLKLDTRNSKLRIAQLLLIALLPNMKPAKVTVKEKERLEAEAAVLGVRG